MTPYNLLCLKFMQYYSMLKQISTEWNLMQKRIFEYELLVGQLFKGILGISTTYFE